MTEHSASVEGATVKSPVHDQDFLLWAEQQAALLRAGNLSALDRDGILEELEDMGNAEKQALQSLLRNILAHFLKVALSTATEPKAGWYEEISEFRAQAETKLLDTPSLNHYADELFQKAWPQARKIVEKSFKTYDGKVALPEECPYTLQQVLDYEFFPE